MLYMKRLIKSYFLSKKGKIDFLYSYDIINYFLIISYKIDIKIFYLYKYYINKYNSS